MKVPIQVIYNSIGNRDLNASAKNMLDARTKLCPALGYLYPDCKDTLLNATTIEQLKEAVKGVPGYAEMIGEAPDPSKREDYSMAQRSMDDIMYDQEAMRYALSFDQCNQVAIFYGYIKLK